MMEPITATLTTAKEIYEAAKTIQKVYNVSKEMKTVAESEGKDQIMATKDLASTASKMQQEGNAEKTGSKNKDLNLKGDLSLEDSPEVPSVKGDFVDKLNSEMLDNKPINQKVEFVDRITEGDTNIEPSTAYNTFVDELSTEEVENNTPTSNSENFTDTTDVNSNETEEDSPRTIKTINDSLVGQNHPETGVPYVEKEVVADTGEKVKGVFPQFDSKIDVQLPEDMEQAPDRTQFAECNKQLAERVAKDPELRSQFTEDQLADIEDGYTPEGYTWHHNEEKGKMQLVDSDIHSQTRHTGGRNIWGGGTENRH